jgi:hypothetical protein
MLIPQALKNILDSLLLHLGSKREMWPKLVQAMKNIPTSTISSIRRTEECFGALETQLVSTHTTIATMKWCTRVRP